MGMTMQRMLAVERRDTGGPGRAQRPDGGGLTTPNPAPRIGPTVAPAASSPIRSTRRFGAEPRAALRRHWQEELADEARHTDPFERMATALLVFASAVSVLLAGGAASQFVEGLDQFAAWVQRLVA
jgi:hypothetical protein